MDDYKCLFEGRDDKLI